MPGPNPGLVQQEGFFGHRDDGGDNDEAPLQREPVERHDEDKYSQPQPGHDLAGFFIAGDGRAQGDIGHGQVERDRKHGDTGQQVAVANGEENRSHDGVDRHRR